MYKWYVMHSKPRREAFLFEQLLLRTIEAYLPSIPLKSASARFKKQEPLFPGYLFVHVDLMGFSLSDLQWIPGAIDIVSYGGEPAHVPDTMIQAIQAQVQATSDFREDPFRPGDTVLIRDGLFANHRAIFDRRLSGQDRVRVLLELLHGQRLHVELSAGQLQPLTQ